MKRIIVTLTILLFVFTVVIMLSGCSGVQRGCSSWWATQNGSDWIVVQYDFNLEPKCAWKLTDVSITNESGSDGIYWKDTATGHLVHISGWYNRVQVTGSRFADAANLVGVDINFIKNGKYVKPAEPVPENQGAIEGQG